MLGFNLDVGSVSGATDLLSLPTGTPATTFVSPAPSGTYYVRVRAANQAGASGSSNEIIVDVP